MGNEFLTPDELRERWQYSISSQTLANWRSNKKGPGFVKIGGRVLYPLKKVIKYERENASRNRA